MSDIDLVWEVSRFKGFNDGMAWDPPELKDELVDITKNNIKNWENGENYVFTVEVLEPGIPVGRVGIRKIDELGKWNLGFWIHPDYWGNGYATEAAKSVIDFGFKELDARSIFTAHAIWNKQSQRVIQKLGFVFIRENPQGFIKNGKPVAEYEYELSPALYRQNEPPISRRWSIDK